jgi:hypothetical protein
MPSRAGFQVVKPKEVAMAGEENAKSEPFSSVKSSNVSESRTDLAIIFSQISPPSHGSQGIRKTLSSTLVIVCSFPRTTVERLVREGREQKSSRTPATRSDRVEEENEI